MTGPGILLLPTHKNDLFRMIQDVGLDHTRFEWERFEDRFAGGLIAEQLTYATTEFHYLFQLVNGQWRVRYSPGEDKFQEEELLSSWTRVSENFWVWVNNLKRQIEAPDLWATIAEEKAIVAVASAEEIENTPFTPEEQKQISAQLNEIKAYLTQTQQFNEQQAEQVNRRFDYLADAATRLGRKDWLNLAVGVITGIAIQLLFQPSFIHELFQFIGKIFKPLLGGALPLP